jgi:hypothetical protein
MSMLVWPIMALALAPQDDLKIDRGTVVAGPYVVLRTSSTVYEPVVATDREHAKVVFWDGRVLLVNVDPTASKISVTSQGKTSPDASVADFRGLTVVPSLPGVETLPLADGWAVMNRGDVAFFGIALRPGPDGIALESCSQVPPGERREYRLPLGGQLVVLDPKTSDGIRLDIARSSGEERPEGWIVNTVVPAATGVGVHLAGNIGRDLKLNVPDQKIFEPKTVVNSFDHQSLRGVGVGVEGDFELFTISLDFFAGKGEGQGTMSFTDTGTTTEGKLTFDVKDVSIQELTLYWPAVRYNSPNVEFAVGPRTGYLMISEKIYNIKSSVTETMGFPPWLKLNLEDHLRLSVGEAGIRTSARFKLWSRVSLTAGAEIQATFGDLRGMLYRADAGAELRF